MFERVTFKLNAKKTLYGNWKVPILVTLVSLVVSLIFKAPQIFYRFAYGDGYVSVSSPIFTLLSVIATGIISYASTVFYLSFVENPKTSFLTFLDALNYWLRGVLTLLWQTLWIFLWSLCFIIPGIVKVISYSQMFYLLAEYPKMGINRAMKISTEITKGYRGQLFMMCLSFFGLLILNTFTFGILSLYINPYMSLSFVNAYKFLKAKALETGRITEEDLKKEF